MPPSCAWTQNRSAKTCCVDPDWLYAKRSCADKTPLLCLQEPQTACDGGKMLCAEVGYVQLMQGQLTGVVPQA